MKTTTITKFISDFEFESINETGSIVKMDMYEKQFKKAHSPMELVLSAVAGCAAVDVVQMLKKKRKTVTDLTMESEGNRREDYPKAFTDITIKFLLTSPDTTEEELAKVVKLAVDKYCSVSASLKGSVDISYVSAVKE